MAAVSQGITYIGRRWTWSRMLENAEADVMPAAPVTVTSRHTVEY